MLLSQQGLPRLNEAYHVERGWAGQTWTWCSQRVSLKFSLAPKNKLLNYRLPKTINNFHYRMARKQY